MVMLGMALVYAASGPGKSLWGKIQGAHVPIAKKSEKKDVDS
jgi:hypothetical protein